MVLVHVFNTVNENYLCRCAPLWLSITDHLGRENGQSWVDAADKFGRVGKNDRHDLHVHLYYDGPAESPHLAQLRAMVAQYEKEREASGQAARCRLVLSVTFADDLRRLSEHAMQHEWPSIVFGRFFVAQVLPVSVDRVIYLDVDMAVLDDLVPLYQLDLGEATVGAVRNDCFRPRYFNSGMMLIDLAQWRAKNYEERLVRRQHEMRDQLVHPDQDVLNDVLAGDTLLVSTRWNGFFRHELAHRVHCTLPGCLAKTANQRSVVVHHWAGSAVKGWMWPFRSLNEPDEPTYRTYAHMHARADRLAPFPPYPDDPDHYHRRRNTFVVAKRRAYVFLEFVAIPFGVTLDEYRQSMAELDCLVRDGSWRKMTSHQNQIHSDSEMIQREMAHTLKDAVAAGYDEARIWADLQHIAASAKLNERLLWSSDRSRVPDIIFVVGAICNLEPVAAKEAGWPQSEFALAAADDVDSESGCVTLVDYHTRKKITVPIIHVRPLSMLKAALAIVDPVVAVTERDVLWDK